ncbi:hypothetical protein CEXT_623911 [Caerostris extrusa]|uniref:Uncharacterized protein n=1 Tax=Caerostris extrusa TaxID=172846 RepID=A0AAV4MFE1_CAEEX|nr:hypothetical protein CEXT_623911 [Caerostris extrusa]
MCVSGPIYSNGVAAANGARPSAHRYAGPVAKIEVGIRGRVDEFARSSGTASSQDVVQWLLPRGARNKAIAQKKERDGMVMDER